MSDNEKEEDGTSSRGADWEVVSLSASAYAAAPGPQPFEPTAESKEKENITIPESSAALFASGHFVFPPSEHENLPLLQETSEIHVEQEGHKESTGVVEGDKGIDNSGKEKLQTESKDSLHGIESFDEVSRTSSGDVGSEEGKGYQRLTLSEQDTFTDHYSDSEAHQSGTQGEIEAPLSDLYDPKDHTKRDEDELDGSNLPCQAWWNRHVASLYRQAREANTFWSVVVAAAVLGIIVLGQRWQRDKWQFHHIKWRFNIGDEGMSRMLRPLGRFKDVLVGSHQPTKLIR